MEGFTTEISTDDFRDICERLAVAEERLTMLYDYIAKEDLADVEKNGHRARFIDADTVKLITCYTEKMATFGEIKRIMQERKEDEEAEKETKKTKGEKK